MRRSCWRALVLYALALSMVSACRCKSKEPGAVEKAPAKSAARYDPAPEPDYSTLLRCGDFLTSAEVQALGLDASKYNADFRKPNEGLGVTCAVDKVTVAVFHGASFESMREGARNGIAQGMLKQKEGPEDRARDDSGPRSRKRAPSPSGRPTRASPRTSRAPTPRSWRRSPAPSRPTWPSTSSRAAIRAARGGRAGSPARSRRRARPRRAARLRSRCPRRSS